MNKSILFCLLLFFACKAKVAAPDLQKSTTSAPIKSSGITAALSNTPVPSLNGYQVFDSAYADLNLDGYTDLLVIYSQPGEDTIQEPWPVKRPLIIYLGSADGKVKESLRTDNAVLCAQCGGVFGDPYAGVTLQPGYIELNMYGGSSWRWSVNTIFRYDTSKNDWFFIQEIKESFHVSEPDKIERTVRDSLPFEKISLREYDTFKDTE
jgi:hypothetical protein